MLHLSFARCYPPISEQRARRFALGSNVLAQFGCVNRNRLFGATNFASGVHSTPRSAAAPGEGMANVAYAVAPWSLDAGQAVLEILPADERLILPALQAIQEGFGYVPKDAVALVATALNVSVADVHGVLTYYHELRTTAPAPITVALCVAEACQATGARELVSHLQGTLAALGERSVDGEVDLVEVFCLGNCALGPAALINERLVGRLTPKSLESALADTRAAL
jgi:formate dehydrogenase subunit gamma